MRLKEWKNCKIRQEYLEWSGCTLCLYNARKTTGQIHKEGKCRRKSKWRHFLELFAMLLLCSDVIIRNICASYKFWCVLGKQVFFNTFQFCLIVFPISVFLFDNPFSNSHKYSWIPCNSYIIVVYRNRSGIQN